MKKNTIRIVRDKYLKLRELATKFNLSFSSRLVLRSRVIGLDGVNRRLLVAEISDNPESANIIELDHVKSVSVRKTYSGIKAGELDRRGLKEFLNEVHLQFEYVDGDNVFVLPFYERETDDFRNLSMLERNARTWQMILSKMINAKPMEINKRMELSLAT